MKFPGPCVVELIAGEQVAVVVEARVQVMAVPLPMLSFVPGEPTPESYAPPLVSDPVV